MQPLATIERKVNEETVQNGFLGNSRKSDPTPFFILIKTFSFLFQDIVISIFYQRMAQAFAHHLCLCILKLKQHLRLPSRKIKCDN